jgi:hypothetical protein
MAAPAQTAEPSENVTVTANKLREIFHKFTDTFATPTKLGGGIARWKRRICPLVLGQNPHFTAFITQRVKYIALAAGARINTEPSCTPNIEIIFTTTPQALMDTVRKDHPLYLGYADTNAQLEKLAIVTRPVQAWYTTETGDANGRREVDSVLMTNFDGGLMFAPHVYASSGGRTNGGIVSGFFHILIVVDSTKMAGQKIVPLSDYIAMLALTQINSLDACQRQQPSIVNMLAADCDHAQDSLSEFDLAYLQGLYRMGAGRGLMFQRNDIADTMADKVIDQKIAAARR